MGERAGMRAGSPRRAGLRLKGRCYLRICFPGSVVPVGARRNGRRRPMGRPAIIEREPRPLHDDELVARIFRALGDVTRLRILELLLSGEMTQKEIVLALGATQSRVSEHVACLTWCGLVSERREGQTCRYRIAERELGRIIGWGRGFLEANEAGIASCRMVRASGPA